MFEKKKMISEVFSISRKSATEYLQFEPRYCFSAAASMAVEVVREWKNLTGLDIHESYGMTESAAMVTYNHYYQHVVGFVGTPINLVEVHI
jgi:long-chain acyl-CoA synthetase